MKSHSFGFERGIIMPEGFEPIASFWSIEEARLAKFRLEEDDIDVFMDGEKMVATNWIDANAVGGVKLLVHATNVERALEILDSIGHSKAIDEPSNYRSSANETETISRSLRA